MSVKFYTSTTSQEAKAFYMCNIAPEEWWVLRSILDSQVLCTFWRIYILVMCKETIRTFFINGNWNFMLIAYPLSFPSYCIKIINMFGNSPEMKKKMEKFIRNFLKIQIFKYIFDFPAKFKIHHTNTIIIFKCVSVWLQKRNYKTTNTPKLHQTKSF